METGKTLTALVVITTLHGTTAVSDTSSIPPYYDEDTDTVVYHFAGDPVIPEEAQSPERVHHGITPYYDEDTDTVIYHFNGSRGTSARTKPASRASSPGTWYYDEETGTIVHHHAGHRSTQATAMMGASE